jgi:hypothetical protein
MVMARRGIMRPRELLLSGKRLTADRRGMDMPQDHNYYDTLIAVADDCPVAHSEVPEEKPGKKTVANIHYEMLADKPFTVRQEDVLFETWFRRQPDQTTDPREIAKLREEFFARPKPCLRTSPLAKRFGWGFLFDPEGRVKLCSMESDEYRSVLESGEVKVLKAMASRK